MSVSVVLLVVSACVILGVIARCGRDVAVLRRLERLTEDCDPGQRFEICRILAASLGEAERAAPHPELPPSESGAQ